MIGDELHLYDSSVKMSISSSRKVGLSGSWPPEQTDLPATLPPSEVKREGPVECKLSRSDDEAGNGRGGVSVSERRSPQVRSVTRRQCEASVSILADNL